MQFKQYQKKFFKNFKKFSKIAKVSKILADKMNVRVKETLITEEVLR